MEESRTSFGLHNQTLATNNPNLTSAQQSAGNGRREPDFSGEGEQFSGEAWAALSGGFERVQSVLDQNRALIKQVNENHESRIPDNLAKNVALIREINGNIRKVVSIYSDLSHDFTDVVSHTHSQRRGGEMEKNERRP